MHLVEFTSIDFDIFLLCPQFIVRPCQHQTVSYWWKTF